MNEIVDGELVDPTTGELVLYHAPPPATLFRTDDPAEVLVRATDTANQLARVVRDQGLIVRIGQSDYARVEAWTMLGSLLGVYPVCVWTRKLEDGWEARVEARTRDGAIVGAAEAECLRGERTWKNRDDYALRSMAQTRATSKALRQPLGFVMTLAGFDPTPAEEMPTHDSGREPRGDIPSPAADDQGPSPAPQTSASRPDQNPQFSPPHISPAQLKRLHTIASTRGVPKDVCTIIVRSVGGVESSRDIPVSRYDAVIEAIESWTPALIVDSGAA